ncbi:MAG: DUF5615 family PIN-like protein [Chloroflexi bacterium]|nr:DUF5615 family PIN-like protein [Chloroflexota bacterium]
MPDRIRFYLDEHISKGVLLGLRRRGVDVIRAQDVGMSGATDLEQLAYAQRGELVFVTHDNDFLRAHRQKIAHSGIAFCDQGALGVGEMIDALFLIFEVISPEEMVGRVEFL